MKKHAGNSGLKDKLFPIIARIISDRFQQTQALVTHNEILARLLRDAEAQTLVSRNTLKLKADNLVRWFSAHYEMHKNGDKRFLKWGPIFDQFGRAEIHGRAAYKPISLEASQVHPDEVLEEEAPEQPELREGSIRQVLVNAYERDPRARELCIEKYGRKCAICAFSFRKRYGKVAERIIHVHHLRELSEIRKEYVVDPIRDLRPVCPNCHAVLHSRKPAFSIEEVMVFVQDNQDTFDAR